LEVRYTLDGSLPVKSSAKYTGPIIIKDDIIVTASIFLPNDSEGHGTAKRQFFKTKNYQVTYRIPYNKKWPGNGETTLIDFFRGDGYIDGNWQGWEKEDMDVVVNFGEIREIESVSLGCRQLSGQWIFFPNYVEVELSEDGKIFKMAGRLETIPEWQRLPDKKADLTVTFPKSKARYIRVFAKNIEYNPGWHHVPGGKSWIFVDEITIK